MGEWSRRDFVTTGVVGAAAAGGLALSASASAQSSTARQTVKLTGPGAPTLPQSHNTYRFPLSHTKPQVSRKGGTVVECTAKNFPVVGQSDAAVFLLTLEPGAIREPHWHPNAWELEYVVSGTARLGVVVPDGTTDIVDLSPGDIGFVPRGWGHYIENIGKTVMKMPIVFGNNQPNDVGLSTFFAGLPTQAFARTLGLPEAVMAQANKPTKTLFIVP